MTNLSVFAFEGHQIRWIDGKPVANDVAAALGYADPVCGDTDCYSVFDILAISVELGLKGKTDKSESALRFVKAFGMVSCAASERLYHSARIHQAWVTSEYQVSKIPGYVYLIECKANKTLKIGYSKQPEKRLIQLQIAAAHKLELITKIPGSKDMEKSLHKEFGHLRLSGEWFRWDNSIIGKFEDLS